MDMDEYNAQAERIENLLRAKGSLLHWKVDREEPHTWHTRPTWSNSFRVRAQVRIGERPLYISQMLDEVALKHAGDSIVDYLASNVAHRIAHAILTPESVSGLKSLTATEVNDQIRQAADKAWLKGENPYLVLLGERQWEAVEKDVSGVTHVFGLSHFSCPIERVGIPDYLEVKSKDVWK